MQMPTHEDAMLPVLTLLAGSSTPLHRGTLSNGVADRFGLSAAERALLLPSGKAPVIHSRTGWALTYLKQAGLVQAPRRGWYEITDRGRAAVARGLARVDSDFLAQYEEFQAFRARARPGDVDPIAPDPVRPVAPETLAPPDPVPPDEALEQAYGRLRASVEAELLDALHRGSPAFFEQVVVDLLVRMGYGGSRAEAARAVGRSGDGGIDGVIDEDRLGLDVIYVQAKRWEGSVGRPEVQKFAGALQGQRARKGILLTTSAFTRDAREYAERIDSRIVLIDGPRLAGLMFEYDVGVSPRGSYTVKSLDGDYFDEA